MKLKAASAFLATGLAFVLTAPAFAQLSYTPCSLELPGNAPPPTTADSTKPGDAFTVAYNYLVTFYPRWFTYYQGAVPNCNRLSGPDEITPDFKAIVAVNDDTRYALAFIGVAKEPVIVTVPPTTNIYSVLHLDLYGNILQNSIPSGQPGVYGLTGPDWNGLPTLPAGVIPVALPYNYTVLIFRADKYSPTGEDMRMQADNFRRSLHAAALSDYLNDPNSGATQMVPAARANTSFKLIADNLIATDAIEFLSSLQTAVLAGTTQPMTAAERALSDSFNALLSDHSLYPQLNNGAKAAFRDIVVNYLTHTIKGSTWINFTNVGEWDTSFQGYLDRSSIMEYLQFGNNHAAAAYYDTFRDGQGAPLDGNTPGYTLRFANGQQPQARRFWSVTAYTPDAVEMVPNAANKYLVARYTPGLVTAPDGSVTILMASERPDNFPEANWLPIPKGRFSILLRVYGPEGNVLENSYVPPPIERWRRNLLR